MFLFLSWSYFVIFTSLIKINSLDYIKTCCFMFFITFCYQYVKPIKISIKVTIIISIIPSIVFWYFIIIYNNFLSIDPFQYELLIFTMFCYSYTLFYITLES